jgi:hypothetical protein
MARSTLKREIDAACMKALHEIGFERRQEGIAMTQPNTEGMSGWIGFDTASGYFVGQIEVHPTVGVHWEALQRLQCEVAGRKYNRSHPATIATPLYTLMAAKRPAKFNFRSEQPLEPAAQKLASAVKRYALPYVEQNSKVENLIARMDEDNLWEDAAERLLCARYLLDPGCDLKTLTEKRLSAGKGQGYDLTRIRAFSRKLQALAKARKSRGA